MRPHHPSGARRVLLDTFDTVETEGGVEKIVRYAIHIFGDGTIIFLENGVVQRDGAGNARVREIDGQKGWAGFGPSPTCPFDHVFAEYEIELAVAGGHSFAPPPSFWGGTPPPRCSNDVGSSIDGKSNAMARGKQPMASVDTDGDGLIDDDELNIGTDPCHHDTDGDGLIDTWEAPDGIATSGFDLNGDGLPEVKPSQVFGRTDMPNPLHQDAYVEVDAFDCANGGCPPGDPMVHGVDPEARLAVELMFQRLPVNNPDITPGVDLHLQIDEHIPHKPNCDQPPIVGPYFGTADQRRKPEIVVAKELAYFYMETGHSTFTDAAPTANTDPVDLNCPTPSLAGILAILGSVDNNVPPYDNSPFGASRIGGRDIIVSLGPLWICPRTVVQSVAGIGLPNVISHVCDRGFFSPGQFPTTALHQGRLLRINQPYARLFGRVDPTDPIVSELRGITQIESRAFAHLLGQAFGLSHADALNDPAKSDPLPAGMDYWGPDVYASVTNLKLANNLYTLGNIGGHLTYTDHGLGVAASRENTVFDNPILELLDTDRDGDGVIENVDNCTGFANADQADLDGDGLGDACDFDVDGDSVDNTSDAFPRDTDGDGIENPGDADDDGDGVADAVDNCRLTPNAGQANVDGDALGNVCDPDADNDGVSEMDETVFGSDRLSAASRPEFTQLATSCADGVDNDGDGSTDAADNGCADADVDSMPDFMDPCPSMADLWRDLDGDGMGDSCDADIDNDGIDNDIEAELGSDAADPGSVPETTEVVGTCSDGVDNDLDGLLDGDDLRCQSLGIPRAVRSGFDATTLPANDDGSSAAVPLGFTIAFGGASYSSVYVNNNGNLTFDAPNAAFTPASLATYPRPIVAPFWGDVDTRIGNVVRYGWGMVDGRRAFAATWPGVGCWDRQNFVTNSFQAVLIDRTDRGPGAFDIELNYDQVQWDTESATSGGQFSPCQEQMIAAEGSVPRVAREDKMPVTSTARVGFSNGAGSFFEFPGSGVEGAFLDTNTTTGLIYGKRNARRPGRYVFPDPPAAPADIDADGVPDDLDNCPAKPDPSQADSDLNGIGDACQLPPLRHTSAAFLTAKIDGTSFGEPVDTLVANEPSWFERLKRMMAARLEAGYTTPPRQFATNLVNSLVELGLVKPGDAQALIDSLVPPTTSALSYTGATSGDFHDPAPLSAVLTDTTTGSPAPVAGKTVVFRLNSAESCSAVTDATGVAACSVTPGEAAGTYPVTAEFAGDSAVPAASASASFTVTVEQTTLAFTGSPAVVNGQPVTLAALLREDGVTPIVGRSVSFALGSGGTSQTCAAVTDGTGTATCTISAASQGSAASVPVGATFAGDAFYASATAATTLSLGGGAAPPCTQRGGGDIVGPMVVNSGEHLCLDNARVAKGVVVTAGGSLTASNSKLVGLDANGAAWLRLCGDDVSGSATVAGGLAMSVSASTGPVVVGDPTAGCAANRLAAGAAFAGNTGGVTVAGNTFAKGLTVTDGQGATVLRGNTLFGPLACTANNPAPVNGGQTNSAPSKTGQCLEL